MPSLFRQSPKKQAMSSLFNFCKVSVTNLTYKMFANEHYTHYGAPTDRLKFNCRNIVFPFRTPAMAGGLFSIHREFFDYLGGYDRGMRIWGAENLAMSFKVSLVFIDCQKSKPMSVLEVAFCRIHQYFPTYVCVGDLPQTEGFKVPFRRMHEYFFILFMNYLLQVCAPDLLLP